MKRILSSLFIVMLMAASFTAFGQEASEKEKKERELQFFEQKNRTAELEKAYEGEKSERALERLREHERSSAGHREFLRSSDYAQPAQPAAPAMTYSTGDGVYIMSSSGSSSSQLSLSKKFEGQSSENEGTFDVDESVRHISLHLSGKVSEGAINITITLPDGDELKDLSIDTSADIQFNQTIRIADEEDRYYGAWEYTVESDEAVGFYRLSIQTR